MPRPFPFALGIGTDVCHIVRIFNVLDKQSGSAQHFLRRCLNPTEIRLYKHWWITAGELDACKKESPEFPRSKRRDKFWSLARFMSGRWAAKEAAIKAHTLRRISMHDITIYGGGQENGQSKAPVMTIKAMNDGDEEHVAKLSISHDGEYATAVCLVAEETSQLNRDLPATSAASLTEEDTTFSTKFPAPEVKIHKYAMAASLKCYPES